MTKVSFTSGKTAPSACQKINHRLCRRLYGAWSGRLWPRGFPEKRAQTILANDAEEKVGQVIRRHFHRHAARRQNYNLLGFERRHRPGGGKTASWQQWVDAPTLIGAPRPTPGWRPWHSAFMGHGCRTAIIIYKWRSFFRIIRRLARPAMLTYCTVSAQ